MMTGVLILDGWAVTFGTASPLYQMQQSTQQDPVYQLHIIRSTTQMCEEQNKRNI